ncbi:lipopolysaccharide biosynthesis protein [Gordonia soli]|uniref:Polysaccharide biosynthesis protein n=1 Tax=Gordonia soli NBRC 108243 TaxID=1223545 RepID=M0QF60_9ACTN|nr:hypothetical protein [Gordonia soli]GAC67223.1 hypothetical protein GS4_06_00690 [Gordonia soli NBRC 108243]
MTSTGRRALVGAVGAVAVGSMVANVCNYLVHVTAGRWWLSPADYGEFAVLLSAMLVLGVPALALQAVTAREVVRNPGRTGARSVGLDTEMARIRRLTVQTTVVVAVLAVAATPIMALVADTGWPIAAAALATAPVLAVIGAGEGVLQGRQQFRALAWVLAGVGVVRTVPVVLALALGGGPFGGLLAGTVGAVVGAVAVWAMVAVAGRPVADGASCSADRSAATDGTEQDGTGLDGTGRDGTGLDGTGRDGRGSSESPARGPRLGALAGVARASQVQLVLIVAASLDLLLTRSVLDAGDAGVYALGAIATKVAFWLPQAIGVVFYPRLADPARSRRSLREALTVVAVIGAALTVLAGVAGPLVPILITPDYRPLVPLLWVFAATGALLSVLQVALLSAIARDRTAVALIAWVVVVVEVVTIVLVADSVVVLAVVALVAATVATVTTTVYCLRMPVPAPDVRETRSTATPGS